MKYWLLTVARADPYYATLKYVYHHWVVEAATPAAGYIAKLTSNKNPDFAVSCRLIHSEELSWVEFTLARQFGW